jgi:catechol-2,3-dioxygenase
MAFRRLPSGKSARSGKRRVESSRYDASMSNNPNLPSKVSVLVLGVSDVAKSAPFYRDAVGLELKSQHEGLAFFSLSGITLMLNGSLSAPGARWPERRKSSSRWKA